MNKETLLQAGIFTGSALLLYEIGRNEELILAALAPSMQFLLVVGLGFGFHWMRGKFRVAYGGIELYIGMFAIGSVTLGLRNLASAHDELLAETIGSVYLMVRGLDNIAAYRGHAPPLRWLADRLKVRAYGAAP